MKYRILLIGGGTGGHIFPLVAVAKEIQREAGGKGLNLEVMALADSEIWRNEFENAGIRFKKVITPKFRRVEGGRLNLLAFFKLPVTLIQSLWVLFIFMPDLVLSKGGYVSLVPSLVAKLYFIPLFIHESDAVLKGVNKFLSKFSEKIFISFESVAADLKNEDVVFSGNPVRKELAAGDKSRAASRFNLKPDRKTVLFLGGSQGAVFINNLLLAALVQLAREFQIIHQTGEKNLEKIKEEVERTKKEGGGGYGQDIEQNYRVFGFLDGENLKNAYALADVVVARAGANLIFEIAAAGKPAIVIPYKYSAAGHQKANAMEFAKFGSVTLEEANLKPHILIDQIERLIDNPSVGEKIRQFAKPDAGKIIAAEIFKYLNIQI